MADAQQEQPAESTRWPACESNPDVMNKLARDLGLPKQWSFVDVFGLDEELLMMVPQPVMSIILLFPSSQKTKVDESLKGSNDVFFLRQVDDLDDACCTIAMVHTFANCLEKLTIGEGVLRQYIEKAKTADPNTKGLMMAGDKELARLHRQFSRQGQTSELSEGEHSGHHFVAFLDVGGDLYEFDGCKPFPQKHGKIQASLLFDTAKVVREKYMRDPTVLDFSMISLGPTPEEEED